jgi:methylmalonic aciduria homocystinuria type C protein
VQSKTVRILRHRAEALAFDLVGTFSVNAYNASVPEDYRLPATSNGSTGILLGNTRRIWPRFIAALRQNPCRLDENNPFDSWICESVETLIDGLTDITSVRYAHSLPPDRVAIQRAAALSGLAWNSPAQLSIHPKYGPWVAWRAVLVLPYEVVTEEGPLEELMPCCKSCEAGCIPVFEEALSATTTLDAKHVREQWKYWLAVRDACDLGREWRYDSTQIEYHYTANPEVLSRAINA